MINHKKCSNKIQMMDFNIKELLKKLKKYFLNYLKNTIIMENIKKNNLLLKIKYMIQIKTSLILIQVIAIQNLKVHIKKTIKRKNKTENNLKEDNLTKNKKDNKKNLRKKIYKKIIKQLL